MVRRVLLPWTGSEQARAASLAAAGILLVHPLSTFAVAELAAREALFGLVLGLFACALFLRGRQDRRPGFTLASLAVACIGGFAAQGLFALSALLAAAELVSTHRYRPLRVRLRTTATTFFVFGAGACLALFTGVASPPVFAAGSEALGATDLPGGAGAAWLSIAGRSLEKLGLVCLPANPYALGIVGTALAGSLFLVAVQPGLVAARSAPRLWGWLLAAWFFAFVATTLTSAHLAVSPGELSAASELLPAVAVMCFGLALGATAMSGPRRVAIPLLLILGYAWLAHGNARPWGRAQAVLAHWTEDVERALELHGTDGRLILIDPPRNIMGIDPIGAEPAFLVEPPAELAPEESWSPPQVQALSQAAFLAWTREPEFALARAESLAVLAPRSGQEDERRIVRLGAAVPSRPPRTWRRELRSPDLDLEALEVGALSLSVPSDTTRGSVGALSWKARGGVNREDAIEGVWTPAAGESRALFDLSSSLDWRLDGRIGRVWFSGEPGSAVRIETLAELPMIRGSSRRGSRGATGSSRPQAPSSWPAPCGRSASWTWASCASRSRGWRSSPTAACASPAPRAWPRAGWPRLRRPPTTRRRKRRARWPGSSRRASTATPTRAPGVASAARWSPRAEGRRPGRGLDWVACPPNPPRSSRPSPTRARARLRDPLRGAGVHLPVPQDGPAGLRDDAHPLRAGRAVHRAEEPEALPVVLPRRGTLPRGGHQPHPRRPGGPVRAAAHDGRGRLFSARRHPHRGRGLAPMMPARARRARTDQEAPRGWASTPAMRARTGW